MPQNALLAKACCFHLSYPLNKTAYSTFQTQRLLRATQHQKRFLTISDNHTCCMQSHSGAYYILVSLGGGGELKPTFPRAKSAQVTKSTNESFPYQCTRLLLPTPSELPKFYLPSTQFTSFPSLPPLLVLTWIPWTLISYLSKVPEHLVSVTHCAWL